jgi:hypothetical protein
MLMKIYFLIAIILPISLIGYEKNKEFNNCDKRYRCCFKNDTDKCCERRTCYALCFMQEIFALAMTKACCVPDNNNSSHCINSWCPYTSPCNTCPTIYEWTSTGSLLFNLIPLALTVLPCVTENHYKKTKGKFSQCCPCISTTPIDTASIDMGSLIMPPQNETPKN